MKRFMEFILEGYNGMNDAYQSIILAYLFSRLNYYYLTGHNVGINNFKIRYIYDVSYYFSLENVKQVYFLIAIIILWKLGLHNPTR